MICGYEALIYSTITIKIPYPSPQMRAVAKPKSGDTKIEKCLFPPKKSKNKILFFLPVNDHFLITVKKLYFFHVVVLSILLSNALVFVENNGKWERKPKIKKK